MMYLQSASENKNLQMADNIRMVLERVMWRARNELVGFDWRSVLVGMREQDGITQYIVRDMYAGWVDAAEREDAYANPEAFYKKHSNVAPKETLRKYVHLVKRYFDEEKQGTSWLENVYCKISSDLPAEHMWNTFYMCDVLTGQKQILAIDGLGIDMKFALPLELSWGRFYLLQEIEVLFDRGLITEDSKDEYLTRWVKDIRNEGKLEWEGIYEEVLK